MSEVRKAIGIGIGIALLAAGCGGAAEREPEPLPADSVAVADTLDRGDSLSVLAPGLPDTVGFGAVPPPAALPADTAPRPAPAPAPTPAPTPTPPAPPAPRDWTVGVVDVDRPRAGTATLTAVRAARNPEWDRVVFQFDAPGLPGYHLEYVDRPVRACGSGDTVPLPGDAWLEVRLEPTRSHDDAGRPTVQDRAQRPNLPNLLALRSTCDFEGQVVWVLALRSPRRFRVLELREPARIVVDVAHP